MIKEAFGIATVGLILATASPAAATDRHLEAIFDSYQKVRLALANDAMEGVHPAAQAIQRMLTDLAAHDPVADLASADRTTLLAEAAAAAEQLVQSSDLNSARDAFYALTKALVRWHQTVEGGPGVAYCPMEKRSWLQDRNERIGNPYLGRSMQGCGELVRG